MHASSSSAATFRWLHLRCLEYDIEVSLRNSDGQRLEKKDLGRLDCLSFGAARHLSSNQDLVILEIPAAPFQVAFFPHRNPLRNLLALPSAIRLWWRYQLLLAWIKLSGKPLLCFDLQDSAGITARFLPFIRHCVRFGKRELPRLRVNVFHLTEPFSYEPWRNRTRYGQELAKIVPLSLAAAYKPYDHRPKEKAYDVFWSGTVENSEVRRHGVRLLHELREEGYRILIVDTPMEKAEFLETLAKSLITFCPDGNGWQCWRTFESANHGSVPLMTFPLIQQDMPFVDGENCLYYNPEGDHLKVVVRQALLDRARLERMGLNAQAFVASHHHEAATYHRHIAASLGSPTPGLH